MLAFKEETRFTVPKNLGVFFEQEIPRHEPDEFHFFKRVRESESSKKNSKANDIIRVPIRGATIKQVMVLSRSETTTL